MTETLNELLLLAEYNKLNLEIALVVGLILFAIGWMRISNFRNN